MKYLVTTLTLLALATPAHADEYDAVGPVRRTVMNWQDGSIRGGVGYKWARIELRYAFLVCDQYLYVTAEYNLHELAYSDDYFLDREPHPAIIGIPPDFDEIAFEGSAVDAEGNGAGWISAAKAFESTSFDCSDHKNHVGPIGRINVLITDTDELVGSLRMEVEGSFPLTNEALEKDIRERQLAAARGSGGIVLSGGDDSSDNSGGSYDGSSSSSSGSYDGSSSSSSGDGDGGGGGGAAAGSIGGLGGIVAAGATTAGSSDTESDDYDPIEYGKPSLFPTIGTIAYGTGLGIGMYFVFGYAVNSHLEQRIAALPEQPKEPLTKLDWSGFALLGPAFSYSFFGGYVRERHTGMASADLQIPIDATMSGVSMGTKLRFHALRFELGYHHMRGNVIPDMPGSSYSDTQAIDSLVTGAALQLGWHQAFSPYLGVRYRLDIQNGELVENFTTGSNDPLYGFRSHNLDSLQGSRTLGTLGVQVNIPPKRHRVMFRSFSFNVEAFRALDDSGIESGLLVEAGLNTWVPPRLSRLDGMTGYAGADGSFGSWMMPFVYPRGVGFEIFSWERKHKAVTALAGWVNPSDGFADAGVAGGAYGPRLPLPGGRHALILKLAPLSFSTWTQAEDLGLSAPDPMENNEQRPLGKLRQYAFGEVRAEYHAVVLNHTLELGVRAPMVWWTNRATNKIGFDDARFYDGPVPLMPYLGFGF